MTKALTIIKYRGSITRLLQSLSTLRGLGRPITPQDSLLADDQSLPGRIDYLQDHVERFQFCSSPFSRLTWRDATLDHWPAGGCQSSTLFHSESMTQANFPYSDSSIFSSTLQPSSRNALTNP